MSHFFKMPSSKFLAVLWKNSLFYKQTFYWLLVIFLPVMCLCIFRINEYLGKENEETYKNVAYFTDECKDLRLTPLNLSNITPAMFTTLLYAPKNKRTNTLMEVIRSKNLFNRIAGYENIKDLKIRFSEMFEENRHKHQTKLTLENILTHPNGTKEKVFGLIFHIDRESKWPNKFTYDIMTSKAIPIYLYTDIQDVEFFDNEAFSHGKSFSDTNVLQILVDNAFITAITGEDTYYEEYDERMKINNMPVKRNTKKGTATEVFFVNFLRSCIIIYKVASIVREEKETGLKEIIEAAGVTKCKQEICLFIIFYVPIAASIILESLIMTGWYEYLSYVLFVTNIYIISCIYTAILIGNIGTTSFGVLCCILIWITSGFLQYLNITYNVRSVSKIVLTDITDIILLMLPPNCYYTILIYLEILSRLAPDASREQFRTLIAQENSFSMKPSFSILLLLLFSSIFIILLLLWYVDHVFTGVYGNPQKFYFFLTKSFWFQNLSHYETEKEACLPLPYEMGVEPQPKIKKVVISLRNISKKFNKNEALKGINLDICKNVMTVVLGPNGSGKSVILGLMAGLIAPTRGQIYRICDKRKIGFCPTKNVFFSRMTALQNIKFFAMLRGTSYSIAQEEAKSTLEYLHIDTKKDYIIDNLSVAMKRKISIAMAMVGSSKILVLDEPTAGIDQMTKREIWQTLTELKRYRTIIIASQNSIEAELFADSIFILHDGNILCHGSVNFLRHYYDTGYVMNIFVNSSNVNPDLLLNTVQEYIPNPKIKYILSKKISIFLTSVSDSVILELMRSLEKKKKVLKIIDFSFTKMTLEDIFLKSVGFKLHYKKYVINPVEKYDKVTNNLWKLYSQQILALIFKQLLYIYAIWPTVIILFCISISITMFSSYTSKLFWSNIGKVSISLSLYEEPVVYNGIIDEEFSDKIRDIIANQCSLYVQTDDFLIGINKYISLHPFLYDSKFVIGFDHGPSLLYSPRSVYGSYIGVNVFSNAYLRKKIKNDNYSININLIAAETNTLGTYHVEVLDVMVTFTALIVILTKQREEYSTGVRKLQMLAGVPKILYWLTTYFVDNAFFLSNTCIVYAIKYFFNPLHIGYFLTMELLNLNVLLPFVYFLSLFRINTAIIILLCFLIIPQYLYTFIHVKNNFKPLYIAWFPGLTKTVACYLRSVLHSKQAHGDGIDLNDIFVKIILIQGIIMWTVFIFIDNDFYGMLFYRQFIVPPEHDDADVMYEDMGCKRLINYLKLKENIPKIRSNLFINQLIKYYRSPYKSSPALKDVSFATEIGTCFGIVGINNSGKSTVAKLLIGEEYVNGGQIYAFKKRLNWFTRFRFQRHIGYCPEIPAVFTNLTGKQMLWLMAMIKGIALSKVNLVATWWLDRIDTYESGNKRINKYTPGMKKRLSFAISLIGNVPILILDEPTEGVDPGGKGQIRRLIAKMINQSRTILMTTQSIEECESLCDKIAIMNNGSVRCIGNIEYIKEKYSEGYTVTTQLRPNVSDRFITDFLNLIPEHFRCEYRRRLKSAILFLVREKMKMSEIFETFENIVSEYPEVMDITVHDTTLEELYFSIKEKDEQNEEV